MNAFTQYFFTHLMHLGAKVLIQHFHLQFEAAHPENVPKVSEHGLESPSFFIMHADVHLTPPQQCFPQSFNDFLTSRFLDFQIFLSSSLQVSDIRKKLS